MPALRLSHLLLVAITLAAPAQLAAANPFRELDLIRPARVTRAVDFTVPGLGSPPVRLRDFKGKVILLNFWATWCLPCKEEMPSMERLYQRYKDQAFTVLAISLDADGAAAVVPFARSLKLTFPIGLDPRMDVANRYEWSRSRPASWSTRVAERSPWPWALGPGTVGPHRP